MGRPNLSDAPARLDALHLDPKRFWLHYACCGGTASDFELDAILHDSLRADRHEVIVIDHALWELETGLDSV